MRQQFLLEWHSWKNAKCRCYCPGVSEYKAYGARGIVMCDQWRNSFAEFLKDMGPRPEPKRLYSIDRIDVNGNYEPGNCRWADAKVQGRNKRPFKEWHCYACKGKGHVRRLCPVVIAETARYRRQREQESNT